MSIIAYYLRANEGDLPAIRENATAYFFGERTLPDVEAIDIDKAYEPLAWLASPLKREEMAHMAALIMDTMSDDEARANVARLDEMSADPYLVALEGRTDQNDPAIDLGMGPAAYFTPDHVAELSAALGGLNEDQLRASYDPASMEQQMVSPDGWLDEGHEILSEYVFPALSRLKQFYSAAANLGQRVIIAYQ